MNIGIVTTWTERGASYVSKQIMDSLNSEHNVFIYARGGEQYEKGNKSWDTNNVYWGKKLYTTYSTSINIKDFLKWIRVNEIDTIIFNEQRDWESVLVLKKLDIKVGTYVDYYTEETISFFNIYDFVICNTQRHFDLFSKHNNPIYIPWGTDINLFKPIDLVENNKITFFHSSGVSPYRKGTDLLISAFSNIENSRAKLIIHTQVDLYKAFAKDSRILSIMKNFEETGQMNIINKTVSAPGLYNLGDIYVYPSRLDGLGLTVAEALSCGLPVITSNQAPMNEFIDEKFNGKLIDIKKIYSRKDGYYWPQVDIDVENLSVLMTQYIDNPEIVVLQKKSSREYAEEFLNWDKNSEKLSFYITQARKTTVDENLIKEINDYQLKNFPLKKIFLSEMMLYFTKKIISKK